MKNGENNGSMSLVKLKSLRGKVIISADTTLTTTERMHTLGSSERSATLYRNNLRTFRFVRAYRLNTNSLEY